MNVAPFTLSLTFLPLAAMGLLYGGIWTVAGGLYSLVLIPIIDHAVGLKTDNADPAMSEDGLLSYRALTWLWVPIQLVMIFGLIAVAGFGRHLSTGELFALATSFGLMTGGIGITYAHELMHQTNRFERALSEVLMTSTLYGHFCIEHVQGHHVHVATPKDPVTARFGQSVYAFYLRAIAGSLVSAWRIQRSRLARRGRPVWHISNPFWRYGAAYLIFFGVAYALARWLGVALFAVQAIVAILLLETINYVEHYGLTRRLLPNGRFEPVQPHHSWNASHKVTNYLLINLQRHSDHHKNPQRRFPVLQHYDDADAPQLPFGYPAMLLIAFTPPLWFRLMDKRVLAWRQRFSENRQKPDQ